MYEKDQLLSLDRPKTTCAECGVSLEEMDRNPTRLRFKEGELKRADFCPDCWEFCKNEAYESFWVTRRIKKDKTHRKLSRREKAVAARALFESLWERRDQEDVEVHLYFLSHLLLRWGGLKWVSSEKDDSGRETIIFENPTTGDPLEIHSTDAPEEQIAEIRDGIDKFLREFTAEDNEEEAIVEM